MKEYPALSHQILDFCSLPYVSLPWYNKTITKSAAVRNKKILVSLENILIPPLRKLYWYPEDKWYLVVCTPSPPELQIYLGWPQLTGKLVYGFISYSTGIWINSILWYWPDLIALTMRLQKFQATIGCYHGGTMCIHGNILIFLVVIMITLFLLVCGDVKLILYIDSMNF